MIFKQPFVLELRDGDKEAKLELPQATDEQISQMIQGLFSFMREGEEPAPKSIRKAYEQFAQEVQPEEPYQDIRQELAEIEKEQPKPKACPPEAEEKKEQPGRPRRLPLLRTPDSGINTLADAFKKAGIDTGAAEIAAAQSKPEEPREEPEQPAEEKEDVDGPTPEGMWPNIRYAGGATLYRCRYWCKNCENVGNRYIPLDNTYVRCHDCQTKHTARPAMGSFDEEGVPHPDRFGNFFRADAIHKEEPEGLQEEEQDEQGEEDTIYSTKIAWSMHTARVAGECAECQGGIAKDDPYYRKSKDKSRYCAACYEKERGS